MGTNTSSSVGGNRGGIEKVRESQIVNTIPGLIFLRTRNSNVEMFHGFNTCRYKECRKKKKKVYLWYVYG